VPELRELDRHLAGPRCCDDCAGPRTGQPLEEEVVDPRGPRPARLECPPAGGAAVAGVQECHNAFGSMRPKIICNSSIGRALE
jgi:hypothetical protein